MNIREETEDLEIRGLSKYAVPAKNSAGREQTEPECSIRTVFMRDIDRITHSKSFRRLKHKTQVFIAPEDDHFRTRLTHTLEVTRISRTIARALRLNEDLTEAISLGHDLGHTPFGHAGERSLGTLSGIAFRHNEQSLRVVEVLEADGHGLNLTREVRDGILCHTGDRLPATLEGQIIRLADRIAYINHDIDDALRAGIITNSHIPDAISSVLGRTHSERINTLVLDVIGASLDKPRILMTERIGGAMDSLREFMFENVYMTHEAKAREESVFRMISKTYDFYIKNPDKLESVYRKIYETEGAVRAVLDYISGMTDTFITRKIREGYP